MRIELTGEQEQAAQQGRPVEVIDPTTQRSYVLIAREAYQRHWRLPEKPARTPAGEEVVAIPPGIRCAQEAFWDDLPGLLAQKSLRGRWVLYHGKQRVGTASSERVLIREALERGLRADEFYTDVIEPHTCAPWEVEDITPQRWPAEDESLPPAATPS